MAERAQQRASMEQHPDVVDLQRQYGANLGSPQTVVVEGLLALAGAWAALSPWVLGFAYINPTMAVNNLFIGVVVAALGLGITGTAERGGGLSWIAIPLGGWLIISMWIGAVISPGIGMMVNNIITGAAIVLIGAAVAGVNLMAMGRNR